MLNVQSGFNQLALSAMFLVKSRQIDKICGKSLFELKISNVEECNWVLHLRYAATTKKGIESELLARMLK